MKKHLISVAFLALVVSTTAQDYTLKMKATEHPGHPGQPWSQHPWYTIYCNGPMGTLQQVYAYTNLVSTNRSDWALIESFHSRTNTATDVIQSGNRIWFYRAIQTFALRPTGPFGLMYCVNMNLPYYSNLDDPGKGRRSWADANTFCENLTLGGYSDWRLPTRAELQNLLTGTSHPLVRGFVADDALVPYDYYWSSDMASASPLLYWTVGWAKADHADSATAANGVWAVRP